MNIEIANRLVNLRKQNNLSQEALAEKLGISRQAVSKWERAEASPDTDNLILLARLYGVSLDELLKTEDEIPMPEQEAEEADRKEGTNQEGESGYTGGQNGSVRIGKDGIHVVDKDGSVHIGWHGIHVQESGQDSVEVGWNGIHIVEDGEEVEWKNGQGGYGVEPKIRFPLGLLVCFSYLLVGILYRAWHPGWLLLFLIPVLDSFVKAIEKRDANCFAYPIAALLFFLALGFCAGNWMGWIAFLTIPMYYALIDYIKSLLRHRKWKKEKKMAEAAYREMEEEN